ncbi:hypothetical protein DH2020_032822 [Rehmannia glutinosa]|uniref:Dof zinc finger protein n=1 Tax=Rehmannia glutinosa TaxID=99300 RepID=A0ABR0VGA9_REHGL
MDKKPPSQQDPNHPPLKCPRCDSCNTKFCYYNNYSLSQPRHFCKACKRYWTRGGTLRNVPVGGGCRKNKRAKRAAPPPSSAATTIKTSAQQDIDLTPNSNHVINSPLNFPFSGMFDYHRAAQMNGLGVRFSSGLMVSELQGYENGSKQIQDPVLFGSSNFAPTTSTLMSYNEYPGLMPYEDVEVHGVSNIGKEVKREGENGFGLNNPNQIEQINDSTDSSLLWNTTNAGAWFYPSNMGSSVTSLI